MVNDRRYKRYFIILENEDRGFEKADKQVPKGYAKIEVRNGKGLLNVYVQDLKYFKNANYIYRNYLISTKGEKSVYVDTGAFMINERGKGELKVKFNPDNVEGSERSIEDFNVVAVIAKPIERSLEETEVYGPLVGYMDKEKVDWKKVVSYEEKKINDDLNQKYKEKYEEIIDIIEKSSKELYKEDTKKTENKEKEVEKEKHKEEEKKEKVEDKKGKVEDKKDKIEEKKEKVEDKEEGKKEHTEHKKYKEYKKYDKDYYADAEKKCDDCVDSLEEYDNKKMKFEKYQENKEEIAEEKKEEVKVEKEPEYKKEKVKKTEKYEKKKEPEEEKKEEVKVEKKKKHKDNQIREEKEEKESEKYEQSNFEKQAKVHYKKYHKMVYKYVKDVLKHYQKIQPFEENIKDYTWWKISYNKQNMYRGFLPFFGYILSIYYFNPYIYYMNNCENLMSKYGHYMFGISYDKDMEPKYYVYGVPGRYMHKDQPFQGMTGFIYWHPLEDKKPEKGDYGYWLLHIDAKMGNVIFPMKPTVPPMY